MYSGLKYGGSFGTTYAHAYVSNLFTHKMYLAKLMCDPHCDLDVHVINSLYCIMFCVGYKTFHHSGNLEEYKH